MMPLIKEFVSIRKQSSLSHRALAAKAGISWGTLERWEFNETCPSLGNFQAVLNALGYELFIAPLPIERNDKQ